MKFYGIELKGKLVLQKVDGLPTFDSARDEGRLVYNESDGKIYHGTDSDWVEGVISGDLADVATSGDYDDLSNTPTLGSASEVDYTISTDDPSGGSDGDVWYVVE